MRPTYDPRVPDEVDPYFAWFTGQPVCLWTKERKKRYMALLLTKYKEEMLMDPALDHEVDGRPACFAEFAMHKLFGPNECPHENSSRLWRILFDHEGEHIVEVAPSPLERLQGETENKVYSIHYRFEQASDVRLREHLEDNRLPVSLGRNLEKIEAEIDAVERGEDLKKYRARRGDDFRADIVRGKYHSLELWRVVKLRLYGSRSDVHEFELDDYYAHRVERVRKSHGDICTPESCPEPACEPVRAPWESDSAETYLYHAGGPTAPDPMMP